MTLISPPARLRFGLAVVLLVAGAATERADEPRNWLCGGSRPWVGRFEQSERVVYPWTGVDDAGWLRKAVGLPSCYPFITKSNQFTYAWLGTSASFVDLSGDGLPDLVSPDGNGMFWFWKNNGSPGRPAFDAGEVMPILVDDQRSTFAPVFAAPDSGDGKKDSGNGLDRNQLAEKKRIDSKRDREYERAARKNERQPKEKRRPETELRKEVAEMFPYPWETASDDEPAESRKTHGQRVAAGAPIPPGGLSCILNSFRRLRLVACPVDWNADGAPDFLAGDSGGTVYLAANTGKPGAPNFGYSGRDTHALPLKVVARPAEPGKPPRLEAVTFLNYAMPFACDWDANGNPDLLLGEGTYSVNTVRLFPDVSRASLQSPPRESALYVGEDRTFLSPFAHDWDGDGDLDLFVNDADGRLTVHRRDGSALAEPQDLLIEGGNSPLAFCTPHPCDWNADSIMDLVWGEPFGRIMVSLGKERGGLLFGPPEPVRSRIEAATVEMPASSHPGRTISLAAVPARVKDIHGGVRNGGTADARRYFMADGTRQENQGGWPDSDNKAFYGVIPSWTATPPPPLASQLAGDDAGKTSGKQGSWGIAPYPGEVWEVVDEAGAPGEGRTLLLRWHDTSRNAVFKSPTQPPPQWPPGAAVHFDSGLPDPFSHVFTKKPVVVKFWIMLEGQFSRMDVVWNTCWGPLVKGKPPVEGGDFYFHETALPQGRWIEVSHTEEPHEELERGLQGSLAIMLLGKGVVRIRDVRVFEGN